MPAPAGWRNVHQDHARLQALSVIVVGLEADERLASLRVLAHVEQQ